LFSNLVKPTSKFDEILRIPNVRLFFCQTSVAAKLTAFGNFSQGKSSRKYYVPVVPPVGRNWQLIFP
jgi:hypothetical protein